MYKKFIWTALLLSGCSSGALVNTSPVTPTTPPAAPVASYVTVTASPNVAVSPTSPIVIHTDVWTADGHGVPNVSVTWLTSAGDVNPRTSLTDVTGAATTTLTTDADTVVTAVRGSLTSSVSVTVPKAPVSPPPILTPPPPPLPPPPPPILTLPSLDVSTVCVNDASLSVGCRLWATLDSVVWTSHITSTDWDFGDGSRGTATGITVKHTFPQSGTYLMGGTVRDDAGHTGQVLAWITVQ